MENIIEIRGLCKAFGSTSVLSDLNLTVRPGEIVAVIGSSGCGKSVLLRSVVMLEKPDAGQIIINGQDISSKGADIAGIRRSIGIVFQDLGLFSNMNVRENLCIAPVKLLRMSRKDAEEKAAGLLAAAGMAGYGDRPVTALSGGQKQRVAICRALMMDTQVLLFDEPTSALDPSMVGEVLAMIRMLSRRGLTMIIVTHEMSFIRQIADRVVFLSDGMIYEEGTPAEIFENPKREKTEQFVRKLKHISYHIGSRSFDLIELQGQIQLFCDKYGLSKHESYSLQLCTEEMLNDLLDAVKGGRISIDVCVSFSEKDFSCELSFSSVGEYFNPFEQVYRGDKDDYLKHLGLTIIRSKADSITHQYENNTNTITLKLLPFHRNEGYPLR